MCPLSTLKELIENMVDNGFIDFLKCLIIGVMRI